MAAGRLTNHLTNQFIMKKIVVIVTALLIAGSAFAQTKEDIDASVARVLKLTELCAKTPKSSGVAEVDDCVSNMLAAAQAAMKNSTSLESLYGKLYGENGLLVEGKQIVVADVAALLPDILALSKAVTEQATSIAEAGKQAAEAVKKVKEIKNPMAAAKVVSSTKFIADVTPVLVDESAAQVKVIAAMADAAKTAANQ